MLQLIKELLFFDNLPFNFHTTPTQTTTKIHFLLYFISSFAIAAVVGSFFEWTLHRFVMHRPAGRFSYTYDAHTRVHHHQFKADGSYHLNKKDKQDPSKIPMAWWNGPVLVAIFILPFIGASLLLDSWAVLLGAFTAVSAYFAAYEYMHWCMYLLKARRIERSWVFHRLNGHHLLHHRYMRKNFNVVFPLADLCLGTLMIRSKCHFTQPTGPAVPDVQPKQALLGA